jgi:hypothetical protein
VTVGFGSVSDGSAAEVAPQDTLGFLMPDGKTVVANLKVTFDRTTSPSVVDVAHEGAHVRQYQTAFADIFGSELRLGAASNLTRYQTERGAFLNSVTVATLGGENYSPGGHALFRASWTPAERVTAKTTGLDALLRERYRVTPQSQGPRLYESVRK